MNPVIRVFAAAVLFLVAVAAAGAQELEPRAYLTLPTGMNIFTCGYTWSRGGVLSDPNLPLQDVQADVHSLVLGYMRSFSLAGRSASVSLVVPCVFGSAEGLVSGEFAKTRRDGLADPRVRFAVNLLGGPALPPKEFRNYRQKTNLGVSLTVSAPLGQYNPALLINLGANRWAFKPEVGVSHARGKWLLEGYVGVWLFTANHDFFGGKVREQRPVTNIQGHIGYAFRKGWMAMLNANYYIGGQIVVDGVRQTDLQSNSRIGGTLFIPLAPAHALKISVASGAYTAVGSDFTTLTVTYQYRWF